MRLPSCAHAGVCADCGRAPNHHVSNLPTSGLLCVESGCSSKPLTLQPLSVEYPCLSLSRLGLSYGAEDARMLTCGARSRPSAVKLAPWDLRLNACFSDSDTVKIITTIVIDCHCNCYDHSLARHPRPQSLKPESCVRKPCADEGGS